jgi:hypothetical protein
MKGDFGESLANVLLGQSTAAGQLFETVSIGGKWPTIDIYAEITSANNEKKFCFFQVKSTEMGYTTTGKLKVQAKKKHLVRLSSFCAPTYLIGVEYNIANPPQSLAYIKTIRGVQAKGISSMEVTHPINSANLILLKNEVEAFWAALNPQAEKNHYLTNF